MAFIGQPTIRTAGISTAACVLPGKPDAVICIDGHCHVVIAAVATGIVGRAGDFRAEAGDDFNVPADSDGLSAQRGRIPVHFPGCVISPDGGERGARRREKRDERQGG